MDKYFKNIKFALGQVTLIFIGVTIAIWFENLNESRKNQAFKKTILLEMITNIEKDVDNLENAIQITENCIKSGNSILTILKTPNAPRDSVSSHMAQLGWYNHGLYHTSAFETIKSKGLDLIDNNSLREKIINYYEIEINYIKILNQQGEKLTWDFYFPEITKKFKDYSIHSGPTPINFDNLSADNEFKQFVSFTIAVKEFEKIKMLELKDTMVELISSIKSEVN